MDTLAFVKLFNHSKHDTLSSTVSLSTSLLPKSFVFLKYFYQLVVSSIARQLFLSLIPLAFAIFKLWCYISLMCCSFVQVFTVK